MEDGSWKSEDGRRKTEVGRQKLEVGRKNIETKALAMIIRVLIINQNYKHRIGNKKHVWPKFLRTGKVGFYFLGTISCMVTR
jgi:hypothetical protein